MSAATQPYRVPAEDLFIALTENPKGSLFFILTNRNKLWFRTGLVTGVRTLKRASCKQLTGLSDKS